MNTVMSKLEYILMLRLNRDCFIREILISCFTLCKIRLLFMYLKALTFLLTDSSLNHP